MRKHSFLFIAGALLALASCQTETNDTANDQATIDSTVNARVEEMRLQMMAQNDSMINALAQLRADSIIAAMKGGNTVTTSSNTTRTTTVRNNGGGTKTTTTKVTPTPQDPQKTRNNDATRTVEDQKSRNNDVKSVEDQKKRNNQ
jgi:hypothetical protein